MKKREHCHIDKHDSGTNPFSSIEYLLFSLHWDRRIHSPLLQCAALRAGLLFHPAVETADPSALALRSGVICAGGRFYWDRRIHSPFGWRAALRAGVGFGGD